MNWVDFFTGFSVGSACSACYFIGYYRGGRISS